MEKPTIKKGWTLDNDISEGYWITLVPKHKRPMIAFIGKLYETQKSLMARIEKSIVWPNN